MNHESIVDKNTNAIVISLKRSIKRRRLISERLLDSKIKFQWFSAVDGKSDKIFNYTKYVSKPAWRGKALTQGEIGCFASHYEIWKLVVQTNQPRIVLEDDIIWEDDFLEVVEHLSNYPPKLIFLRLYGTFQRKRKVYRKIGKYIGREIVEYSKGPSGACAYWITPKAANKLISHSRYWRLPVDDYLDSFWTHGVRTFSLIPFPVKTYSPVSEVEGIPGKKGMAGYKGLSLMTKIHREMYRFLNDINRLFTYYLK